MPLWRMSVSVPGRSAPFRLLPLRHVQAGNGRPVRGSCPGEAFGFGLDDWKAVRLQVFADCNAWILCQLRDAALSAVRRGPIDTTYRRVSRSSRADSTGGALWRRKPPAVGRMRTRLARRGNAGDSSLRRTLFGAAVVVPGRLVRLRAATRVTLPQPVRPRPSPAVPHQSCGFARHST